MKKTLLLIAASVVASGLALGPTFSASADASVLVQPKTQLAKMAKTDNFHAVASRGGGRRSIGGSTRNPNGPSNNTAPGGGGGFTSIPNPNIPDLNGGGNSGWGKIPNPNIPDFNGNNGKKAGKKWHYKFRVHGGRRNWCHKHWYKVPGMHFHSRVRCDHRHYRAYRSWDFIY